MKNPPQILNWVVAHTLILMSLLWYSKNSGVQSLQKRLRPHLSSRGVIWIAWLGLWCTSGTKFSHYFICSSRYRGYQGPFAYIWFERLAWGYISQRDQEYGSCGHVNHGNDPYSPFLRRIRPSQIRDQTLWTKTSFTPPCCWTRAKMIIALFFLMCKNRCWIRKYKGYFINV